MKRIRKGATSGRRASKGHLDFMAVADAFARDPQVSQGGGKGFGSGALKVKGRIFAMVSSKGEFVVKLSKNRVDELASAGEGNRFDPGHGRLMKEWIAVGTPNWVALVREACDFVKQAKP